MMFCSWGGGGAGVAKGIDIEVEIWRAFYGMMFCSCMGGRKAGHKFTFQSKAEVRLTKHKALKDRQNCR